MVAVGGLYAADKMDDYELITNFDKVDVLNY
jgi:hypothetical protein